MIPLAIRYLLARRKQTLLMLLGIFFGTAAYVVISGFMLGFRGYLVDQLVNNNPHVRIQAREDFLSDHSLDQAFYGENHGYVFWDPAPSGRKDSAIVENPQNWYRRLQSDSRVVAYSPQLTTAVVFRNGKATATSTLIGCDPIQQARVTTIGEYVVEGSFGDLSAGGNRLVIGSELKKKLGVRVGQNVMVSLGAGSPVPFKVVGVFRTGGVQADAQAFGALADVQNVNLTPNQVNEIGVRLQNHLEAASIAATWSRFGTEKVESWDQLNANLFDVFKIQDAVRFLSIGAIMVVAAFGIYNVLNMTVMQKRRDIAILRSIGFGSRDVLMLFFFQGLVLGAAGVILGLSFGYAASLYLRTVPFTGGPLGAGTGTLLVSTDAAIYAQAAAIAFVSASLASVLPAHAAGKLTPIGIIRAGAE